MTMNIHVRDQLFCRLSIPRRGYYFFFFFLSQIPCGLDRTKLKPDELGQQTHLLHIPESFQRKLVPDFYFLDFMMVELGSRVPVPFLYEDTLKGLLAPAGIHFLNSILSLPIEFQMKMQEKSWSLNLVGILCVCPNR